MAIFALLPSQNLNAYFVFASNEIENETNDETLSDNQDTKNFYSIFIHKPTYSVFNNKKIYFVDEFDNYFKIFDTEKNEFYSNYIDFSSEQENYSPIDAKNIIDASFDGGYFALLSKNEQNTVIITVIDLTNFKILGQIKNEQITETYTKISVKFISSELAISLTPTQIDETVKPIILFATISDDLISVEDSQIFKLDLNNDEIKNTLIKTIIIKQPDYDGYYLIFLYQKISNSKIVTSVACSPISSKASLSIKITSIREITIPSDDPEQTKNIDGNLNFVNLMEIDGKTFLLTTHKDPDTSSCYSHLYQFDVYRNDSQDKIVDTEITFENTSNPYILSNGEYVTYADQNTQNILYLKIDAQTSEVDESTAKNPDIEIDFKKEEDFVYKTTTSETEILKKPWSATPIQVLQENTDVILIGTGHINMSDGSKTPIEDYNYCLFTIDGTNHLGYIKVSNLTEKPILKIEDFPYTYFKVVPNTNLYSLPTKVSGDEITDTLNSSVIMSIRDNSRVKILDRICDYSSCSEKFLKVEVNGEQVGYIEQSTIIAPNTKVNFVITNCSIKEDGTKVYFDANKNSESMNFTLKKGYRVRVNGARNTTTGYTSVTFNDEYGNEFSGYIITDYIETDSWSTMQIIGLVLIAITLGLLILILYFRRTKIGDDGQKFEQNKKANYIKKDEFFENGAIDNQKK